MEISGIENLVLGLRSLQFIEGHLNGLDLSKLDSFVIGWLERGDSQGDCTQFQGKGNYRILVRMSEEEKYPQTLFFAQEGKNFRLKVDDKEELTVFICFHELFHYMALTNQVMRKNTEKNANAFAMILLNKFKITREQ